MVNLSNQKKYLLKRNAPQYAFIQSDLEIALRPPLKYAPARQSLRDSYEETIKHLLSCLIHATGHLETCYVVTKPIAYPPESCPLVPRVNVVAVIPGTNILSSPLSIKPASLTRFRPPISWRSSIIGLLGQTDFELEHEGNVKRAANTAKCCRSSSHFPPPIGQMNTWTRCAPVKSKYSVSHPKVSINEHYDPLAFSLSRISC